MPHLLALALLVIAAFFWGAASSGLGWVFGLLALLVEAAAWLLASPKPDATGEENEAS